MTRIERYEELRAACEDGAVRIWTARDSLAGVEVGLWTTSVADTNAAAIARLRVEARRLGALGLEVRVFEDLKQGVVGMAYRARSSPSPTRPEGTPSRAPSSPSPPSSGTLSARTERAPRGRTWPIVFVAILALGAAGAAVAWLAPRYAPDEASQRDADLAGSTPRPRPSDRVVLPSSRPPPEVDPPPAEPGCAGVATPTGCLDLAPVTSAEARACTSCPPPDGDVVIFDPSLAPPTRKELEACRAQDGRPAAPGSARCVQYTFAASYCGSRGKRVPTEAEWIEGAAKGMSIEPGLFEWTQDVVRDRMNWTRGQPSVDSPSKRSQADRNLRTPTLGFRCIR